MSVGLRVALAVVVAVLVGYGGRQMFGSPEYVVSPEQIAAAKAAGRPGYESSPGTVTVLPIRSETAGLEPVLWGALGLGAGVLTFAATGRRAVGPRA